MTPLHEFGSPMWTHPLARKSGATLSSPRNTNLDGPPTALRTVAKPWLTCLFGLHRVSTNVHGPTVRATADTVRASPIRVGVQDEFLFRFRVLVPLATGAS